MIPGGVSNSDRDPAFPFLIMSKSNDVSALLDAFSKAMINRDHFPEAPEGDEYLQVQGATLPNPHDPWQHLPKKEKGKEE